jgi:class 3 adenylate cyclase/CheY-like chemotaxis protein
MPGDKITVFLADDNLIVREGVRALLNLESDIEVVGVGSDYDEIIAFYQASKDADPGRSGEQEPPPAEVLVTDIRMPPSFTSEGIDAAKEVRRRYSGTGTVVLSQYDDPEYAVSLLAEGAEGYGYLLKDRVGEGNQLANAIREVAIGRTVLDPKIVETMVRPVTAEGLSAADEEMLRLIAEGKPIKAIAAARGTTAAAAATDVERLFLAIAKDASAGTAGALKRLQMLHTAIVDREEVGERLEKLLPGGLAATMRAEGWKIGQSKRLTVTVLMSDVRGYSGIAEHTDPTLLAGQLNTHRKLLNDAILSQEGTVMQFTGDGVMAVFGALREQKDHADRALAAAMQMHVAQQTLNAEWQAQGLVPFRLGVGLSTGEVAAALLGSEERIEYTLVGDTVNLSARLQDLARPGGQVVLSEATYDALSTQPDAERLEPTLVKGRDTPVNAYKIEAVRQTAGA